MTDPTPTRWAIDLSVILNATKGADRFPVDIPELALEYSRIRFPEDPILKVEGDDLPGFDGALVKATGNKRGWGILYNKGFTSRGRINFTLGHEFGHYLLHRAKYPEGFHCKSDDVVRWDSEYGQVEYQANVFAANILMPLDDFRARAEPDCKAESRRQAREQAVLDHLRAGGGHHCRGRGFQCAGPCGFRTG